MSIVARSLKLNKTHMISPNNSSKQIKTCGKYKMLSTMDACLTCWAELKIENIKMGTIEHNSVKVYA